MNSFSEFINESMRELPDLMTWVYSFFNAGLEPTVLATYADFLDEAGGKINEKAANVLRGVSLHNWRDVKKKTGPFQGSLVGDFYDAFGFSSNASGAQYRIHLHDYLSGSWLIMKEGWRSKMSRHVVVDNTISYRLALKTGKWFIYDNKSSSQYSVVSTRHVPTEDSEEYFPANRITIKDYKPIPVQQVDPDVLLFAFHELIEKQVRGNH